MLLTSWFSPTQALPVPLASGTIGDLEGLQFSTAAVVDGAVLWAGSLSFPSGTVLVTNQSMRPVYQHQLVPGTYDVVVARSDASLQSALVVSFVRTA
jgi:hypothetical protein